TLNVGGQRAYIVHEQRAALASERRHARIVTQPAEERPPEQALVGPRTGDAEGLRAQAAVAVQRPRDAGALAVRAAHHDDGRARAAAKTRGGRRGSPRPPPLPPPGARHPTTGPSPDSAAPPRDGP